VVVVVVVNYIYISQQPAASKFWPVLPLLHNKYLLYNWCFFLCVVVVAVAVVV